MGCLFSSPSDEDTNHMKAIRNLPVIFVNGVPGAGNHTVAETISQLTGYTMIKPGELIRSEASKDTVRGRLIVEKMEARDDIPEQLTVDLIKEKMLTKKNATGFILVGFPRNPLMSSIFNRQVKWPEKVVSLEVDSEVAACRLQAKMSELGRPAIEIDAARQIVKDAAYKVKNIHKRFGPGHVVKVQMDNAGNPKALANTLKDILADTMEKSAKKSNSLLKQVTSSSSQTKLQSIPLQPTEPPAPPVEVAEQ